jgi:glycine C-acetyltransferase
MGFTGRRIFCFPKLEGELGPRMQFGGKEVLNWSLNDYLGLANHPEVRKADTDAAIKYGAAYPMGARMMSGHTKYHEQLENELATFVMKESAYLLNGYQGIMSTIDALVTKNDVIVYDVDAHALLLMVFVCTWGNVLHTVIMIMSMENLSVLLN